MCFCDFGTSKPELRWKEAPALHPVEAAMHFVDGFPKTLQSAVPDRQGQEDRSVSREVFVELRQSFEEAPPPCPAPAPLAKGAETPIAGVSAPKVRNPSLGPIHCDFHANRRAAVPNGFCHIQRLGFECQMSADGLIETAVLVVGLQHARMRAGGSNKTARRWRAMHQVSRFVDPPMLPPSYYKRNPRDPSRRLGFGQVGPLTVV